MIDWYVYLILFAVAAGGVWLLTSVYLPLRRLAQMLERVRRGERVSAWEINGPALIRKAAKTLAEISDEYAALKASRDLTAVELNSALSNIEEGIIIVGVDGVIKVSNQNFNRLFGLKLAVGMRLLDQVQSFEVNDIVRHAMESGEEQGDFITYHVMTDGGSQLRSYRLTATPLVNDVDDIFGCMLVVADFSKIKEMESVERQMVASVSHELRTPLAVFKGYLEALIDLESKGRAETKRILGVLSRHSNRLNQLVEDLLILSQIEEKALNPVWEPVNVVEFLKRVKEDTSHFLDDEIELKIDIQGGVDTIEMDAFRMEQVFHNLIDNSQRHSEGSKQICIGVKRDVTTDMYHFYVEDQGMGIPSDKLPMIFNRFYRVDRARSRARGGTGLGLTIVREIMRAHGGDAWAESSLGEGTTIWFSLPFRADVPSQEADALR